MLHIRAVVNQCGVAMEVHGAAPEPQVIGLLSVRDMEAHRAQLAETNPDYGHATIGQLAVMMANHFYPDATVSQTAWTYNASSNTYERA
jgi:hypothetical protein